MRNGVRTDKRKTIRVGIRTKLLRVFLVALLFIIGIEVIIQSNFFSVISDFEARMSRYHHIQRLRASLSEYRTVMGDNFRDARVPSSIIIELDFLVFKKYLETIKSYPAESMEAQFNIQAIEHGLEAFSHYLMVAAFRRAYMEKDWYLTFATADRIWGYTDQYLSSLLSESLNVGELHLQEVIQRTTMLQIWASLMLFFLAMGFGVFSISFAWRLTTPLMRLAAVSSRLADGELNVEEIHATTGDEVEVLADSFNTMSRSIRQMVEGLKDKSALEKKLLKEERDLISTEKALREAQFSSLQDQIRPHFLFNALNTIARMALIEEASQTEKLTLALARMFRYSLGHSEAMVPLKEELDILREYLSFQALRFGNRVEWEILSDAEAENVPIPRFTLQPLIENAVRHGIEPIENGGKVRVEARILNRRLIISIRDNGCGMSESERMHALKGNGGGIGITNVISRLRLRYGASARFTMQSSPGVGTEIRISLPIEQKNS